MAAKETLERKDPVKKAERAEARDKKKEAERQAEETEKTCSGSKNSVQEVNGAESVARQEHKALPKAIVHAIHQRDRGQCCYFGVGQNRCESKYLVEIHHITPLSRGGLDTIENLVTLCHDHHKLIHETFFSQGRSWVQI